MSTLTLKAGQARDVAAASGHRSPVHGPGTYNGAVLPAPHFLSRETDPDFGITIHEHGIAGAVIRTHRTHRVSPAGWVYNIARGDWCGGWLHPDAAGSSRGCRRATVPGGRPRGGGGVMITHAHTLTGIPPAGGDPVELARNAARDALESAREVFAGQGFESLTIGACLGCAS